MLIDRQGIARLIPHAGDMCLLDAVLRWDDSRIACATMSHRSADNPMRRGGQLGVLCGVEYAAQAMALHAALAGGGMARSRVGYLASLRGVVCHVDRLDLIAARLLIDAERVHGEADRVIYGFVLRGAERVLLEGRAVVVLSVGMPAA